MKKIQIKKISIISFILTMIVSLSFLIIAFFGWKEFDSLHTATEEYIVCENATKMLQQGSDYLTEQVRLYTLTSKKEYMDNYFREVHITKRRETALDSLRVKFGDTVAFSNLEFALENSFELMQVEYRAMKLVAYASGLEENTLPSELQTIELSEVEKQKEKSSMIEEARTLVSDDYYEEKKQSISAYTKSSLDSFLEETRNKQSRAISIYKDINKKYEILAVVILLLMLSVSYIINHLIVRPLLQYSNMISKGGTLPLIGCSELQMLAKTYNAVYEENEKANNLVKHEASYDSLTELLNRRSFHKILEEYETGKKEFALIIVDVDNFKHVNDTYGHDIGDKILQKVASTLKHTFRNIDYVCRIGGDEFAIIMVDMHSDLDYTILEKIDYCNKTLSDSKDELPSVSLSAGASLSDVSDLKDDSIFKSADVALYHTKENGKAGCSLFGKE